MSNLFKMFKIVVFDIDGTIANTDHRVHHVKTDGKKNWGAFFSEAKYDKPHSHIVRLTQLYMNAGYLVVLCTGRPANLREDTEKWLKDNDVSYDLVLMRLTTDRGPDFLAKKDALTSFLMNSDYPIEQVEAIYEDRIPVAEMWRQMGIPVLLCGDEWRPI